jgi:AcrR family transcriptional regulator
VSSKGPDKDRHNRRVGEHYAGDLRRALLDAAARSLDEVGVDGLSLRDVARGSGVSHAAPAHHFGDKVGLLTALAIEGFELFAEHLTTAIVAAPPGPVGQLPVLARAYAEFAERRPGHFAVMFRPDLIRTDDPRYVAVSDAAFELLCQHMAACQQAGWRPHADPRALAAAAWALAHGLATLRSHASLARHYPDPSLDGIATLTATLLDLNAT